MKKTLLAACLFVGITGYANAQPYIYQYGNVWGPPGWYVVPNPSYQYDRYQPRRDRRYDHQDRHQHCHSEGHHGHEHVRCW